MDSSRKRLFSALEYAPPWIVYALHPFYGLWLALKFRSFTLPAIANPTILTGGLCGESKHEMFALVGETARSYFAPFITFRADTPLAEIERMRREAGLSWPLVAKPDIGRNGRGVKIIEAPEALPQYLSRFPKEALVALQKYIADEGEAGVFYIRKPSEEKGHVTSLTLKYFPRVIGDGHSTLRALIERDPRAARIKRIYFRRNKRDLDRIIPAGESYRLVSVGNHVRGALFENGALHITPALEAAFDRIARDIRGFYFGRFDVRFESLEELKKGEHFTILEFNGASSEPTHVWDRRTGIWETYRDLLSYWHCAFAIGAENRARGVPPVSIKKILRVYRDEAALIEKYPDEE